jgi:hypothetical protein
MLPVQLSLGAFSLACSPTKSLQIPSLFPAMPTLPGWLAVLQLLILISKARGKSAGVVTSPGAGLQEDDPISGIQQWQSTSLNGTVLSAMDKYVESQLFHANLNDTLPTLPKLRARASLLSEPLYILRSCERSEVAKCLYLGKEQLEQYIGTSLDNVWHILS